MFLENNKNVSEKRRQRKGYQIVTGPMDSGSVDDIPYDFDSSTGNTIDFIRMFTNQLADLLLIPRYVIIDCLFVGK